MKRDPKLSSELLIKPLDVSLVQVKKSLESESDTAWWKANDNDDNMDDEDDEGQQWSKPTDWKKDSKVSNEVQAVAKKHHMVTDVKKAVFQAIVQSEDYL